ncbi:SAV_6107 family HEPN domain-containing protein [Amycolatopsis sp. lyj-346]|uniref:SAV_6107 family HEPN domain-containing protein n=1 Tax=Amycolatopsis sp. lyj-346 TaxID=2789289 RepID=UPI00397A7C99
MSVKVVSPTDPGQPELPMSLRPQPVPAGTSRGRSRQCLSAAQESHRRPSATVDSRQPQLPISLCTSAEADAGQAELPASAIPEQTRPSDVGADRPERPAVAESGQLELSASAEPHRPTASPSTHPAAAESGPPDLLLPVAPMAAGSSSSLPAPPAAADSGLSLPAAPAAADSGPSGRSRPEAPAVADSGPSDPPVPEAPAPAGADASPELPLSLRPPGTGSDQSQLPMSLRPPASPAAAGLLAQARRGLAEAAQESRPAERFIGAYLAALRGAAAVLAARGRPHRGRARPASTWVLLDSVAPELREWSAFFASNSATRAAAQAGITGKVTAESAAGLVGAATPFLELVRRLVHGLPITGGAHVA